MNLDATAGTASLSQDWRAHGSQRRRDGRAAASRTLQRYRTALTWAFTFFSAIRVLAYLPTMWTLWQSGDSSQHSLWTWCTWLGANLTMSLWLIDRNGARIDRAASVNLGNAAMCLVVIVLIVVERL